MRNRPRPCAATALSALFFLLATATAFALRWARRNYPMQSPRTVFLVLRSDMSGHDSGTALSILKGFVLPSLAVSGIFWLLLLVLRRKGVRIRRNALLAASGAYLLGSFCAAAVMLKAWEYPAVAREFFRAPQESPFFQENYIPPEAAGVAAPERRRNLVMIFMESMESSYVPVSDGGVFEETPIPNLAALAASAVNFSGTEQTGGGVNLDGTSWTAAGLLSKLSGLPYFNPLVMDGGRTLCLPQAKTLNDFLAEQGYAQVFAMGSEKQFENRDAILESHGVTVHDIVWYKENGFLPSDYQVFWGFEDAKLFKMARMELESLAAAPEPFFFGMLTVDTHFPYGFRCGLCPDDFDAPMMNVLKCADRQIADFMAWMEGQPWFSDTTVVILGDHCYLDAPKNNFIREESPLSKDAVAERRRFLDIVVNPAQEVGRSAQKGRTFSSLDIMATVLESTGIK
ncbi:MAG: LTA synthase family protein, partial [Treponemataceae bacterium]|nr:LTA synthase family protein [Treponemataceae bacterium]